MVSTATLRDTADRTGLLAVAAKIRAGNGPVGPTFQRCLEEGQGIARSTLFGPIVRKEAVMAMLILSVWSQYGWLPVGHALRMGLDINLHRALDKLSNDEGKRTEAEERDLGLYLCRCHADLNSRFGTYLAQLLLARESVSFCFNLDAYSLQIKPRHWQAADAT